MSAPQLRRAQYDWLTAALTGTSAPWIRAVGYDLPTDSIKMSIVDPNIAWKFVDSGASDVTSLAVVNCPAVASNKRPRLNALVLTIGAQADDAVVELQHNTNTLASPTWTRLMPFGPVKAGTYGSFLLGADKLPDLIMGTPVGDGATAAHVRLYIVSGTVPKCRGSFLYREV